MTWIKRRYLGSRDVDEMMDEVEESLRDHGIDYESRCSSIGRSFESEEVFSLKAYSSGIVTLGYDEEHEEEESLEEVRRIVEEFFPRQTQDSPRKTPVTRH